MRREDLLVNYPKTKRGQETLDNLCSAAEQLFYEKGYHATSINDITNLASVGTGTFYIYFEEKLAVYKYLLLSYSHEIRKHLSVAIEGSKNRREAEYKGIRSWLDFLKTHKYIYHIIWESLYIDRQLYIEYYETFGASYAKQLQEAKDNGELKDVDVDVLSYILMGISNFVGLNWAIFREEADFDYIADEVMKILEGGIFR